MNKNEHLNVDVWHTSARYQFCKKHIIHNLGYYQPNKKSENAIFQENQYLFEEYVHEYRIIKCTYDNFY